MMAPPADPAATGTGGYFFHMHPKKPSGTVSDTDRQDQLLAECARISGVAMPA